MKRECSAGGGWFLPGLDVLTSLLALFGLLPLAGGLPGITSQGQPLADGLWFTLVLGGALVLLAGGTKLLLRKAPPVCASVRCFNRNFGDATPVSGRF
jgi:hypothetical protein